MFRTIKQSEDKQFVLLVSFVAGKWQSEGVGARVKRIIGSSQLRRLDPFLMLDFFSVKLPAGFPDHPHRGFETVTYMLQGSVLHEDFTGHAGEIGPGDIQWMTAGKGIVHAEMPGSKSIESLGFQLWINLEAKKKFINPAYQEFKDEKIPQFKNKSMSVKVIAGKYGTTEAPIRPQSDTTFIDVYLLEDGAVFEHNIDEGWNGLIYKYHGKVNVGGNDMTGDDEGIVFKAEKGKTKIVVKNLENNVSKFIIITGKPLNEEVHQYGPFVLATKKDLEEAFEDYERGRNGFENASKWASKIRKLSIQF